VTACLAEDDLLELARGRALDDAPDLEAHLADCAACSSLLAALLDGADAPAWGALVGRTLGPYRLEAQIGAGAMGAVYRARDERLGRRVAIKVLPAHGRDSAELARRLGLEARAAGAIAHPNVVTIHDVGHDAGVAYVVAELVEGESLRSVIERGPVPRARVESIARDLARGLAAAHAVGVVHRDLKPENLIVAADGTLKILDFGLAKVRGAGADGVDALDETEPGAIFGTVGYMAPEQARGEPADARSDLFSAGAILYELATGRRAFGGASHAERLSAVLRDTPPLDAGELGELAPVIARCLEKDPRRRFQSAQDLAWVLEGSKPPRRRISRRAWVAGAAVGALALAAALLRTSPPSAP
jgi:serine/threonine protein kinase